MKKDVKYIMKRILIGVGIALILGFLGKKGVLAESITPDYCFQYNYQDYVYDSISNSCSSVDDRNVVSLPTYDINLKISAYYQYNYNLYSFYNADDNYYHIINNDWSGNNYYNIGFKKIPNQIDNKDYYFPYSGSSWNNLYSTYINDIFVTDSQVTYNDLLNKIITSNLNFNQVYNTLTYHIDNYYFIFSYSGSKTLLYDYSLINSSNNILYYSHKSSENGNIAYIDDNNDINYYIQTDIENIIPSYFQEVDITNYQAIYFIPKDYVEVPSFIKDGEEFLHFNYYLNGSVNSGYFNIENTNDDFTFNSDENLVSFADFEYIESSFPLYYKNDDLSAYILFNTGNETKIMYDTRFYNYFLVSDLSDYANEVQFIDENGEEVSRYISFTTLLENYWAKGFQSGGDDFIDNSCSNGGICADNIISYIDFLKLPFTFLRSLSKNNCSPINIPIPFINGNITINCLSSVFSNVLGNFYNILLYIITGLYAYRITLLNIDTITDVLNPSDDKLEVVDL